MTTAYDFSAQDIDGRERSLSEYQGKALLIVNVAIISGYNRALEKRFTRRLG